MIYLLLILILVIFIFGLVYYRSDGEFGDQYDDNLCHSCDKILTKRNCEIHYCSTCKTQWCKFCFSMDNGVDADYFYYEFICGSSSICKKCSPVTSDKRCNKCTFKINDNMEINSCHKCDLVWCKWCFNDRTDDDEYLNFNFVHGITNVCKKCKEPNNNKCKMRKAICKNCDCDNGDINGDVYQCYRCDNTYCKYHSQVIQFEYRNDKRWKGECNMCFKSKIN